MWPRFAPFGLRLDRRWMVGDRVRRILRRVIRISRFPTELIRSLLAVRRARGHLDLTFADSGRSYGWRVLRARGHGFRELLVTPVNSTRYWEFPFVWSAIPNSARRCLDVASPRLLSLRLADTRRNALIAMLNPDVMDADETERIADAPSIPLRVVRRQVEELAEGGVRLCWSINVVEHIAGESGDSDAMTRMFAALRPGGRLIVTVPTDRTYWLEYRDHDAYGLAEGPGPYFFQRFYDETAVKDRLIGAVGVQPTRIEWFGELVAGTFHAYIAEWLARGPGVTVTDPERIVRGCRTFESWSEMPGVGVCGLVFDKPT